MSRDVAMHCDPSPRCTLDTAAHCERMNLTEFTQKAKPNLRRSVVEPFLADVRTLRASGYSFAQICEYLASNNIEISVAGLSAYLRRVDSRPAPTSSVEPLPAPSSKPQALTAPPVSTPPKTAPASSAPASPPRKRFEPPPDPMDAVRRVRQQIAQEKAASNPPQTQGDSIEPNSKNRSSE